MTPSLGEVLVLAAQQRVEPEIFIKFQFRSYHRLLFPDVTWLTPSAGRSPSQKRRCSAARPNGSECILPIG